MHYTPPSHNPAPKRKHGQKKAAPRAADKQRDPALLLDYTALGDRVAAGQRRQSTGQDVGSQGIGIHGTTLDTDIQTQTSKGCIRMTNEDVKEVYDFIPEDKLGKPVPVKVLIR